MLAAAVKGKYNQKTKPPFRTQEHAKLEGKKNIYF